VGRQKRRPTGHPPSTPNSIQRQGAVPPISRIWTQGVRHRFATPSVSRFPLPPGLACPTSLQVLAEHGFMPSPGGIVALPLDGGGTMWVKLSPLGEDQGEGGRACP
jgi:hypothetical protein